MLEINNVYRVQFKKSEPIHVAGFSFSDVIERLEKEKDFFKDGDIIISITIQNPQIYV